MVIINKYNWDLIRIDSQSIQDKQILFQNRQNDQSK